MASLHHLGNTNAVLMSLIISTEEHFSVFVSSFHIPLGGLSINTFREHSL